MICADHTEKLRLYVTKLAHYPVVLGLPWLKQHDPTTGWSSNSMLFDSDYCRKNCNTPERPARVRLLHDVPRKGRPEHLPDRPVGLQRIDIAPISLRAAAAYARRNYSMFAVTIENLDTALKAKEEIDLDKLIPPEFHDMRPMFSPKEAEKLPPHRPYDHDIRLQKGKIPPFGPLYNMSRKELLVLKEWLEENLRKGFIRPSSSRAASPVLFVDKPGEGLRFVSTIAP